MMRSFLLALLLTHLPVGLPCFAQESARYIQMETEAKYLFLDEGGVAISVEKNWGCRGVDWPPANGTDVYNREQYLGFRERRIADGTWDQWICREQPGDVLWSRAIVEAQRKLNMSADKTPCSPWVPETGRYNREMFEVDRCGLTAEVSAARESYRADMVARLGPVLRMEPPSAPTDEARARFRDGVLAAARARQLRSPQEKCGRTIVTLLELVECKMEAQNSELTAAEQRLTEYDQAVETLPRAGVIGEIQVRELQRQSVAVKKSLNRVLDLADGAP